jgi:ribonucleoside-diphosphate reductase alpha chain
MPIELTNRVFTTVSSHPYEVVKWEKTPVKITDESGNIIYELNEAEFPTTWSKTARKITANKYFRESRDSKEKETSLKETITRIVTFIRRRGEEHGYFEIGSESPQIFEDELTHILLNQIAAFNSPVWFNTGVPGVDKPLMSACFINQVDDNMESILDLAKTEGLIFKEGAGSGVNFSRLRASTERIRGGGTASGPVSFMQGYDSFANIIMSGGRTRRSARMCILNADHPDIEKFISCKNEQEAIVERLIKSGMSAKFNDLEGAYSWAKHQTGNNSVRVTNEFMERVRQHMYYGKEEKWNLINRADGSIARTVDIGELFTKIAECAHGCGDPALQFHDTINGMNTCASDFSIEASNPCFTGDTRIYTPEGLIPIRELCSRAFEEGYMTSVYTRGGNISTPTAYMATGVNKILRVTLSDGRTVRCTENHNWLVNGEKIQAKDLQGGEVVTTEFTPSTYVGVTNLSADSSLEAYRCKGDHSVNNANFPSHITNNLAEVMGYLTGNGWISPLDTRNARSMGWVYNTDTEFADELRGKHREILEAYAPEVLNEATNTNGCTLLRFNRRPIINYFIHLGFKACHAPEKRVPESIFRAPKEQIAAYLRGYFAADGTVYGHAEAGELEINCASASLGLLQDIQQLLQLWDVQTEIKLMKKAGTVQMRDTEKVYGTSASYRLRLNPLDVKKFIEHIGFAVSTKQKRAEELLESRNIVKAKRWEVTVTSVDLEGYEQTYNLTEPTNHLVYANGVLIPQCSEFMWVNNSACNLSSINLVKFMREDNTFDTKMFKHVVRMLIIAQDIIVESASYPTKDIELNSLKYRPLGLGYANLGGLLMRWGIPYDSDKGREIAASITSLMTAQAYTTSAELATVKGPFSAYEYNKGSMEEVLTKHRAFTKKIPESNLQLVAYKAWGEALSAGFGKKKEEGAGYRNAQVTLLAPCGTIGLMMDCDTTGIEPAMGLVTYKDMIGGGTIKIAIDAIPESLLALGYSPIIIPKIIKHINDNGYVEGCPDIKEEHLPVFDCAFVAKTRTISVEGHINMVAAVQPFLSGAVSKTFNMLNTATVEDIKRAYMMAWERGLKGVAIYRQGSKFSEPMRAREVLEAVKENKSIVPTRKELPTTVISIRHVFTVGAHKIHLHCGLDPKTGDIMEIFIRAGGFGSTVGGLLDSYATLFSKSLQYGIPLDVCIKHMEGSNFPPAGVTSNNSIPMVKSIMDYVAQWIKKEFIDKKASPMTLAHPDTENGVSYAPHADDSEISNLGEDTCPKCGHVMVRTGTCTMCKNCSYNSGVCG